MAKTSKRFIVSTITKINQKGKLLSKDKKIKESDDQEEIKKVVNELFDQNTRHFILVDNQERTLTSFNKESHQKNYRKTVEKIG